MAKYWEWLVGVSATLAIICLGCVATMWNDLQALKQWRAEQWPLEKQLLLVDNEQLKGRVLILENSIKECRRAETD